MTEQQLKRIHPLDIPLEVFLEDLPTRPRRIINAEMGYFASLGDEHIKPPLTVRHLLMFSRKEIRDWPNMGKKSLNEIEEWLRNIGLQLWEQHDERSLKLLRDHPMYYAAPAAEEAPGQEPSKQFHDWAVAEHLKQQPATHGEPVAWMHTNAVGHTYFRKREQGSEFNPVPLYTAPQPTHDHIKAMQQALEALEAVLSDDQPYIARSKVAITALQNALKGTI